MTTSGEEPMDGGWDIHSGVGVTALMVAGARAMESRRPDALAVDPLAEAFVRAAEVPVDLPLYTQAAVEPGSFWSELSNFLAVRTRSFDDYFAQALAAGARQAVILASGLDARAYRLPWPAGLVLFEIDQPKVLEFKDEVARAQGAEPGCVHRLVPADLRTDWLAALRAAGFDPELPTAWLAEGLLPYLSVDAQRRLLADVLRVSAPGSQLAVEYITDVAAFLADPQTQARIRQTGLPLGELMPEGQPRPLEETLAGQGWAVRYEDVTEAAERHGRRADQLPQVMIESVRFVYASR